MTASFLARLPRAYPELSHIEAPALERFLESGVEVTLKEGSRIFGEGDGCQSYLLLLEGSVRVRKVSESGREIVLYRMEPGQTCILTTTCLISGEDYPAEAIAETDVRALAIPKASFERALSQSAQFRHFIFAVYAQRISHLILLVEDVAFGKMDGRLAQKLLALLSGPMAMAQRIEITHQELAAELGTMREVVSRLLKEFEHQGLVVLGRGFVEVRNPMGLVNISRNTNT